LSDAISHRRRIHPNESLTEGGTTVPRRLAAVLALSLAAFALLTASASAAIITVTKTKNGKTITLHKGDKLVVKLAANATTGYAWKVKSVDKTVLKPLTSKYVPSPNPKHLVGAGGTYKLSLRALAKGSTTLTLVYVRSFDPTHPGGVVQASRRGEVGAADAVGERRAQPPAATESLLARPEQA
jgi:predicted secreted protein